MLGAPLMASEERWKAQLAVLQKELNTPTQFKGTQTDDVTMTSPLLSACSLLGRLHELSSLVKVTEDLHLAQQVSEEHRYDMRFFFIFLSLLILVPSSYRIGAIERTDC